MATSKKKIMRIKLNAIDMATIMGLIKDFQLDMGGGGPKRLPDGSLSVDAYTPEAVLDQLKKAGADFEIIEDATRVGKERQKEVGRGDRFEGGKLAPRGLGKKE